MNVGAIFCYAITTCWLSKENKLNDNDYFPLRITKYNFEILKYEKVQIEKAIPMLIWCYCDSNQICLIIIDQKIAQNIFIDWETVHNREWCKKLHSHILNF